MTYLEVNTGFTFFLRLRREAHSLARKNGGSFIHRCGRKLGVYRKISPAVVDNNRPAKNTVPAAEYDLSGRDGPDRAPGLGLKFQAGMWRDRSEPTTSDTAESYRDSSRNRPGQRAA